MKHMIIDKRYHVIKKLGKGNMGTVYLARDIIGNGEVAIKMINDNLVTPQQIKTFKKEFRLMTRLNHPNLVKVYDFGQDITTSHHYITMEYIPGKPLDEYRKSDFSEDSLFSFIIHICRAIEFIHSRGILHRDIKPANIIMRDGQPVLMDFGLSDLGLNNTEKRGTIIYMAPEILSGKFDYRSDIFSFGMTIYNIMSNFLFYEDQSTQQIVTAIRNENDFNQFKNEKLSVIDNPILSVILQKMLAYSPDERYGSIYELISEINTHCRSPFSYESTHTKMAYVLGAPFVGRNSEIDYLVYNLTRKDQKTIMLYGEPGVGKSRLMTEFKQYCQLNQYSFYESTVFEQNPMRYQAFRPILEESLLHASRELIDIYGPELKKLFPDHEALKHVSTNEYRSPQKEKFTMRLTITDFLIDFGKTSNHNMVFFFNDIQWADPMSNEGLITLIHKNKQHNYPIHIYIAVREEGLMFIESLDNPDICITRQLLPFNKHDIEEYITSLFGPNRISEKLYKCIPMINKKVGGNPFYLQELIRSLVETDMITRKVGLWDLTKELKEIHIPDHINDLIVKRLDSLSLTEDEHTLLNIIALLDRSFEKNELSAIKLFKIEILQKLHKLEILKVHIQDDILLYQFSHDLIKDTILTMIEKNMDKKRELHALIAAGIESNHQDNLKLYHDELAYHYYECGNAEKSIIYLRYAADQARRTFDNQRAELLYSRLIALIHGHRNIDSPETKKDLAELEGYRAELNRIIGNIDKALQGFKKTTTLSESLPDKRFSARAHMMAGRTYLDLEEKIKGLKHLKQAMVEYKLLDDKKGISDTLNYIAGYNHMLFNYKTALKLHIKGLKIAEEIDDKESIFFHQGNMAMLYFSLDQFDKAMEKMQYAYKIAVETNFIEDIIILNANFGIIYSEYGKYDKSLEYFDLTLSQIEELDVKRWKVDMMLDKAQMLYESQDYKSLQTFLKEIYTVPDKYWYGLNYNRARLYKTLCDYYQNETRDSQPLISETEKNLIALLDEEEDNEKRAYITYELWKLTESIDYKNKAITLYHGLFKDAPSYKFKIRLAKLEGHMPDDINKDYLTETDNQLMSTGNESDGIGAISGEIDHIRELMQRNTYGINFHMERLVSLINQKMNEYDETLDTLSGKSPQDTHTLEDDKHKIEFFKELLDITHALNSNTTLDELLEKILDASVSLMHANRGFILLYDTDGMLRVTKARNNKKEPLSEDEYRISNTVISKTIEEEKAVFIASILDNEDLSNTESIIDLGLRSVMCAPLGRRQQHSSIEKRKYAFLTANQKLGLIYLDNQVELEENTFTGSNLNLFQALADQASIAILNTILYESVNIDALTGLFLRPFFEKSLENELRYCNEVNSHVSLMMIDVDFFKSINDRFGHPTGDIVLKELAKILKETLRETDICGRYGGEEFVVILPNTDLEQAIFVANKIQEAVHAGSFPSGSLTISIGISSFPGHVPDFIKFESSRCLVKNADLALYTAKNAGRDRFEIWEESMNKEQQKTVSIGDLLSGNLNNDFRRVKLIMDVIAEAGKDQSLQIFLDSTIQILVKQLEVNRILILETKNGDVSKVLSSFKGNTDPESYNNKLVEQTIKDNKTISTNDPLHMAYSSNANINDLPTNIICVPIIYSGSNYGILYIEQHNLDAETSELDLSYLDAVAIQIALCMNKKDG